MLMAQAALKSTFFTAPLIQSTVQVNRGSWLSHPLIYVIPVQPWYLLLSTIQKATRGALSLFDSKIAMKSATTSGHHTSLSITPIPD
jgi:hypothetical protein